MASAATTQGFWEEATDGTDRIGEYSKGGQPSIHPKVEK
mgnify:FL=1